MVLAKSWPSCLEVRAAMSSAGMLKRYAILPASFSIIFLSCLLFRWIFKCMCLEEGRQYQLFVIGFHLFFNFPEHNTMYETVC